MATTYVESNTTNDSSADGTKTVKYIFLGSRKYPYGLDGTVKTDQQGQLVSSEDQIILGLDVTTKLSNSWEGQLSKYPVSQGSEISDHISFRNDKFTLEGVISELGYEVRENEYFGQFDPNFNRMRHAVEVLKRMFKDAELFTLYTEHEKVDNCVITSVKFDQSPEEALNFSIDIEKVRLAFARTVNLNTSRATKKSVANNTNGGGTTKRDGEPAASTYRQKLMQNRKDAGITVQQGDGQY